jgi:precorrin-3B methylase
MTLVRVFYNDNVVDTNLTCFAKIDLLARNDHHETPVGIARAVRVRSRSRHIVVEQRWGLGFATRSRPSRPP